MFCGHALLNLLQAFPLNEFVYIKIGHETKCPNNSNGSLQSCTVYVLFSSFSYKKLSINSNFVLRNYLKETT